MLRFEVAGIGAQVFALHCCLRVAVVCGLRVTPSCTVCRVWLCSLLRMPRRFCAFSSVSRCWPASRRCCCRYVSGPCRPPPSSCPGTPSLSFASSLPRRGPLLSSTTIVRLMTTGVSARAGSSRCRIRRVLQGIPLIAPVLPGLAASQSLPSDDASDGAAASTAASGTNDEWAAGGDGADGDGGDGRGGSHSRNVSNNNNDSGASENEGASDDAAGVLRARAEKEQERLAARRQFSLRPDIRAYYASLGGCCCMLPLCVSARCCIAHPTVRAVVPLVCFQRRTWMRRR
jgi:hypothetical protein